MLPLWIVLTLLPILGGAERFNCRGRILGAYYADAKSGCKAFHVCVRVAGGGIRDFRFFCPPGTLFHQEAQTCTDWGDDDPLACPADLYDGQFDLYKIGSGFDTKKLSSQGTRDEESEFGLQRAETGDRRSSQNSVNNGPASDLRAAHSSDFFSGQRDRGRDEPAPAPAPAARPAPQSSSRQSFRRIATSRAPSSTIQYTTTPAPPPSSNPPHYEGGSKRKLVRKRPIYVSTQAPTTFAENTPQQPFPPKQNNPPQVFPPKQNNPPQAFTPKQNNPPQAFSPKQNIPPQSFKQNNPPQFQQNNPPQFQQQSQQFAQQPLVQKPQNAPQNNFQQPPQQQQNLSNRGPPRQPTTTLAPPNVNVPPQYKDEYVEVPRVAPKQPKNRYFPNNPTPAPFSQSSPAQNFNKKDSLVELYNYEAQSTPGLNTQNDNRPFKVRNNFQVQDGPREDFARINSNNGRITPTTAEYNTASTRGFATSTPAYKNNYNSVSYEPEKDNFVPYSRPKQNFYNTPSTNPTTTVYSTPANLNTIAYNTNIALNTIQPANYRSNEEDDGQYRLPAGEDDGQYRPELYERDSELLSGAHSINIAASGNRLFEEEKSHEKSQFSQKPVSKTSAPRPFRPAPTPTIPPTTTYAPEPTYTTTYRAPTTIAQRTFDYFQTYTTTVRPTESPAPAQFSFAPERVNNAPARPTTTSPPKTPEPRPQTRAPAPPTIAPPRPSNPPPKPNTQHKQDDSSYDYAYYDSDPGFSEYDHIEEFGRTKTKS